MPGHVKVAISAGSAFALDSSAWYTSMPNTSGSERRTAWFNFWSSGWAAGQKAHGRGARAPGCQSRRCGGWPRVASSAGRARRRLLGLPDTLGPAAANDAMLLQEAVVINTAF